MSDSACPWCGEELVNPFTGATVVALTADYDLAIEAHAESCAVFRDEMGE